MSLASFFFNSKKIDLSSEQSEAGDDTKKGDSLTTSFSKNDDVFLEG